MQQFLNTVLTGVTLGAIYAAFALALVLIWRATRIVNFAQAPQAMITTYIALLVIDAGQPYWVALLVALASGFLIGAVLERVVRPVSTGSPIRPVILTLGIFIALHSVAAIAFGSAYQTFPAPFGVRGFAIGDVTVALTGFGVFTLASVVVVMLALVALFRFTDIGLAMRAVAFDQVTAKLLGVRVGSVLTLGWGLAGLVGALSGMLVAGGGLVYPAFMDSAIVYGFVAAVIGGLDSPPGAVIGGLSLGLGLSLVSGYVGSELVATAAFVLLMAVLFVRPGGLFGHAPERVV